MTIAAEPRPASLPLPGGRAGAVVRLHPLLVATMAQPPSLHDRGRGRLAGVKALGLGVSNSSYERVPVVAFLIVHPQAGPVLIDTGFHGSTAIDPSRAMGRLGGRLYKDVQMASDAAIPDQLREIGVEPETVGTIVMTHLHADHAGGIVHFPEATFYVSDTEWRAASEGGEREGYVTRQFDHAFDYRLLDFTGPKATSYASFGHAIDLFGDGSVVLVATPGHSAGHLSVIVRLTDGEEAFIAGDAASTMQILRGEKLPHRVADEHRFKRSLREMQLYLGQTPDAVVFPGHDMSVWEKVSAVL